MTNLDRFFDAWGVMPADEKQLVVDGICNVLGWQSVSPKDLMDALDRVERDGIQTGVAA